MAGISSHHVTLEDLLLVQPEAVLGSKDKNLVVHGLTCKPFTCGEKQAKCVASHCYRELMVYLYHKAKCLQMSKMHNIVVSEVLKTSKQ